MADEWASLTHQYLARRDPALLDAAIAVADDADVAAMLASFRRQDCEAVDEGASRILRSLSATRDERYAALLLVPIDLRARLTEDFRRLPMEAQQQALETGLRACDMAIQVASVLRDSPCIAFYHAVKAGGLAASGDRAGARGAYGEALTVYRRLAQAQPAFYTPHVATTLNSLGILLRDLRELPAARAAMEEALTVGRGLAQAQPATYTPDIAMTLNNLGALLRDLRELPAARAACEEALALNRRLAQAQPAVYTSDVATTLNNLGNLLRDLRDLPAARAALEEALTLRRRLAHAQPAVYTPDVAMTLNNLGALLRDLRELPAARVIYEEALSLHRRLAQAQPAVYTPDLAGTLNNLGTLLWDLRDLRAARAVYEQALLLRRPLAQAQPAVYTPVLAGTLNNLGNLLRDLRDLPAARAAYDEALTFYRRLAHAEPAVYTPSVATTLNNLGVLLNDLRELPAARVAYDEALTSYRRLAQAQPATYTSSVATTLNNLGNLLRDLRELPAARAAYDEALTLQRSNGDAVDASRIASNWGHLERADGNNPRALALYEEAVAHCERGLRQLRERDHWDVFRRDIEDAYLALIDDCARWAEQPAHDTGGSNSYQERVVGLLEALRQVQSVAGFRDGAPADLTSWQLPFRAVLGGNGHHAARVVDEHGALLWVHATSDSVVFVILCPGSCRVRVAEPVVLARLTALSEEFTQSIALASSHVGSLDGLTAHVAGAGEAAYQALPLDVQALFADDDATGAIFLAPCGATMNLPWELIRVPPCGGAGGWDYLGLRRLLPRTLGLGPLADIIQRQPHAPSARDHESGAGVPTPGAALVVGNPRHANLAELPYARTAAENLAASLAARGFRLVPHAQALLDSAPTATAVSAALDEPFLLWTQMGHGGWHEHARHMTLALAGPDTLTPELLARRRWPQHPIVHHDCCLVGATQAQGGGRFDGHPTAAILAGAACVLASVHPMFDDAAAQFSGHLHARLLDATAPMTTGDALLATRRAMAEEYAGNPIVWAPTVLWGNPHARLVSAPSVAKPSR